MKLVLLSTALLLAGVAGCTSYTPGVGTAAPAPAASASASGSSAPSPSPAPSSSPSPSLSPTARGTGIGGRTPAPGPVLGPSTADVRDCPGCVVRGRRDSLRPGISVALLVGPATPATQRAVFVAYRTRTGKVLGQQAVPNGEYFSPLTGVAKPPVCDRSYHCFVPASVGAHGGTMAAFAVSAAGAVTLAASLTASHPTFTSPDLDGDGVREIVAIHSDCDPACAGGTRYWQVWRLSGAGYSLAGCARHTESATRPPAALDPAVCPR